MDIDNWFSDYYERNYVLLYRIGRLLLGYSTEQETLIEEQIQEAFLRAWQRFEMLKDHPNPDGWLVECFRKCLRNACRKRSREWKHIEEYANESQFTLDPKPFSPEDYVYSKEQIEILTRLLGQDDANLIMRYCVYHEKASVIAKEMNISEQALRMKISRIKKKILNNRELFTCLVLVCLLGLQ